MNKTADLSRSGSFLAPVIARTTDTGFIKLYKALPIDFWSNL